MAENLKFRPLRAEEVDCRVSTINEKGLTLLLYKDARCDMNVLDETVGPTNWQKSYTRDNANCIVSIWDENKKQWISKEDTGTESFTEKEKGLASDSFKRACFNWGIGRELYTAPFIWIGADSFKIQERNGKPTTYDRFSVTKMSVQDGRITALQITNNKTHAIVFEWGHIENPKCIVCGKEVDENFAKACIEANGVVYCSGKCKNANAKVQKE